MRFRGKGILAPRYIEPCKITKRIRKVAYCLDLLLQLGHAYNVFHISMLQKCTLDSSHVIQWVKVPIYGDVTYEEQHIQILEREVKMLWNKDVPLVTILWEHQEEEKVTCELESEMLEKYIHLFVI